MSIDLDMVITCHEWARPFDANAVLFGLGWKKAVVDQGVLFDVWTVSIRRPEYDLADRVTEAFKAHRWLEPEVATLTLITNGRAERVVPHD